MLSVMSRISSVVALAGLLLLGASAQAQFAAYDFAYTGCNADGSLMRSGFEDSGDEFDGLYPGTQALTVSVPDTGSTRPALLYLPTAYGPDKAWPLIVVLHGAAGSSEFAPLAADEIRNLWAGVAEREGAILLAPVASGAQGGWLPANDQPYVACAVAEVSRRYRIDAARRYLWGFSAGAHFGHALALGNSRRFAAYAVHAGALEALACSVGGVYACTSTLPQVPRRIPVSLRVGDMDPLQPYVATDFGRFSAAGWAQPAQLSYAEFTGGHWVDTADVEEAWAWFAPRSLSD